MSEAESSPPEGAGTRAAAESSRGADTLGSVGELDALARIIPRLPPSAATVLGPGDDAAVLAAADGRYVVTTDMMIHGPDFRLAWSSLHDLGFKAAATNLSDVAAMGARPTALVVALAAPAETPVSDLEALADGLREACAELAPGCGVVGGDLSVSPTLTIAVTAFGDLEGREPVRRDGARVGDVVAVSGSLGSAAEGLALLFEHAVDNEGVPDAGAAARLRSEHPGAVADQLTPRPPIADGVAAALAGATSMLDLSDGLALDARRIARASGVSLDLDAAAVCMAAGVDASRLPHVIVGGEDHSLLATFPPATGPGQSLPGGFRVIGRVVEAGDDGPALLVGGRVFSARGGWDSFDEWSGGAG
ncbi:thiamine-phosphate kinase [Chryseoglobus sp. 28M-23]|uniref:thiamine-phosphate kinase n=1 Tax=Chryseoglobus sp. 28M-23 TaxID=2772253 RepID=UPI001746D432|nr:thiamine-phosphate kinase [Chryseoglobus sp. 28M-23]QOD94289.1 thiamine-phosphate kinase [Chryseoglobus sp. 28M-23]